MERNANYALVGLISTILLIAMIVFIAWLANFAFSQRYDTYDVVFHGAGDGPLARRRRAVQRHQSRRGIRHQA